MKYLSIIISILFFLSCNSLDKDYDKKVFTPRYKISETSQRKVKHYYSNEYKILDNCIHFYNVVPVIEDSIIICGNYRIESNNVPFIIYKKK